MEGKIERQRRKRSIKGRNEGEGDEERLRRNESEISNTAAEASLR